MNLSEIIRIFEGKGWSLYKGLAGHPFEQIILNGKARNIEAGDFYHILPAAFRHNDIDEVVNHLAHAKNTRQFPTYDDKVNPKSTIKGILINENGLSIIPIESSFVYEFNADADIGNAIKYNISNYNIHYFNSIEDLSAFIQKRGIAPQMPSVLPGQLRWVMVTRENKFEGIIYPEDASNILFRGQTKRYEPCNPTIARDIKNDGRGFDCLTDFELATLVVNLVKTQWFVEILRETPAFKWMKRQNLFMDETAVAQHYGLPTGYIDLTQSFDVACFFACCKYNRELEKWEPVREGEGVIYAIDRSLIPFDGPIRPVNLQPFPRPSEQWGWTFEMTMGDDFDKLPEVSKFIFKHNEISAQNILKKFAQGSGLFPSDPLSKVSDRIMEFKSLPQDIAIRVIEDIISDPKARLPNVTVHDILTLVANETGIAATDSRIILLDNEIQMELEANWNKRSEDFFKGVGIIFARTKKMIE